MMSKFAMWAVIATLSNSHSIEEESMRAGTQLDPFPQSYEGDPMVEFREEAPPKPPEDEEEEESEDLAVPKRKSGEDPDDDGEAADFKKAMTKLKK